MNQKIISNPLPYFEHQSLSTKKARKKCFVNTFAPPKAPIRSCPVPRTFSLFRDDQPRPVSFREDADNSFITDSPMYSSKKGTYLEQCFTLEKTLGKGSFGEVFRVYSKETGQVFACKRTLLKYRGQSDRSRRIEEVKKHEQLPSHLNCVKFYRAWEEKNHLYLLTEVCQSSLAEIMARKHELPEKLIWSYLVDILQGLHHLHEHKFIHMDVKPENIFLGVDGYCKLGDFGLVVDFSNGYPAEAVEGDPKYLAPECLQNLYTPAADIFSLGMVVLEMASDLYLPQTGPQWHELRSGALPKVAEKVSLELQEILMGFLNPDPQMRLTTTMAFQFATVRQIQRRNNISIFLRKKASAAKSYIQPFFTWPWFLLTFLVSVLRYQRVFSLIRWLSLKAFHTKEASGNIHCDSVFDEFSSNISDEEENINNFSLPSPLVKSTPISNVKRRVILPCNISECHSEQDKDSDANKYSFNESSFSSLDNSRDDVMKHSSEASPPPTINVTSRNLLELFNTAEDSDSDEI